MAKKKDEKSGLEKELERIDDVTDKITKSYVQSHSRAHVTAADQLVKEGLIGYDEANDRYDFSAFKDEKVRRRMHELMMTDFDKRLEKRVNRWKDLTEAEKDQYRQMVYGITKVEHMNLLEEQKSHYTVQAHNKAMEKALAHIVEGLRRSQTALISSPEHIEPALKYLGVPKEQREMLDYGMLKERPDYLRQMLLMKHLRGANLADEEFLSEQPFYKKPKKAA